MNDPNDPLPIAEIVRFLQAKNGTQCRWPQPSDRVGFAFSTKDRVSFTRQALEAMDTDGGYDIIWNDGSDDAEARALPETYRFRNARLVEVNHDVRRGADGTICYGLARVLDHGYDYVGIIENDVVLQPGWFKKLMNLFVLAAADGIVCGAATVRSFESRVIEHRSGYSLNWATGAGMILFSRPAAEIILRKYPILSWTSTSLTNFYRRLFRIELGIRIQDEQGQWNDREVRFVPDWGFSPMLYMHGFASVGNIPSIARDLEFPPGHFLLNDYVKPERNNVGLIRLRSAAPQLQRVTS